MTWAEVCSLIFPSNNIIWSGRASAFWSLHIFRVCGRWMCALLSPNYSLPPTVPSQIFILFLSSDSFYPRFFSLFLFIVRQQPCSSPTILCTFVTSRITVGPCLCLARGFQFPYITLSIPALWWFFWIKWLCEFEFSISENYKTEAGRIWVERRLVVFRH